MPLESFTLRELQTYVRDCEVERGFSEESSLQKCLLLGEEVGELFKAVRHASGMSVDPCSSIHEVASELADVLNFVLAIANRHDIDLGQAFVEKERTNSQRKWIR